MKTEMDEQSFCWSLIFLHPVRNTAAEKEFDIAVSITLKHVSSEIGKKKKKKRKMDEKTNF